MNGAARFQWSEHELKKVFRVFGWTIASAVVALLISLVGIIDVPAEYAFIVPIINTVLYALKEFLADNR
jgi:uncharacterized membrane protein